MKTLPPGRFVETSRTLAAAAAAAAALVLTAGCNTVEGAGEDLEAAGEAIEDTAEDGN